MTTVTTIKTLCAPGSEEWNKIRNENMVLNNPSKYQYINSSANQIVHNVSDLPDGNKLVETKVIRVI